MATAVLSTTPALYGFDPYITTTEYRLAPTGVDVSNLVKGDAGATERELANVILRASSWVDTICGQVLAATADTETARALLDREGMLWVHPRFTPILEVTAFAYGTTPQNLAALSDLSSAWIEPDQFGIPVGSGMYSSAGLLQLGMPFRPGGRVRCRYSYVSGYPNTTLAAPTTAGATSITVANGLGIIAGATQMMIYDGSQTETINVASTYVTGATAVPLASPLLYDHSAAGVSVSALPPAVKQATILLTSTLVQTRGAVALIAAPVGGLSARYSQTGTLRTKSQRVAVDDNEDLAMKLLMPFMRVR